MNEQPLFEPLSRREREILALLCENLRDQEIAERLFLALPTVKWYNRQIFNKLGVENRREACKYAKSLGMLAQSGAAEPALAKHNLPSQLTPFVGRSRELAEIDDRLAHPHTRLLTILAPGGMGKTRLALEAAERAIDRYADGVFFAPLVVLTSTDHVVPALAEALGLQFTPDGRTPEQQLTDFLRRKHLLLLIDNFEHLLDAAPVITSLLTAAPKVTALVTSRERLNLNGETVYPLAGLHYPDAESEEPLRFGAVELFIECAMRTDAHFVVKDAESIGRLCSRVQGMPLAIELAAALAGALSVDEIDAEIARSADFLNTTMANIPERQRSVRAVFEAAWARLDEDARRTFRRMSVFRGGCTREAAQAVTGANIRTLAVLVDKALLWRDPQTGRYDIHELLRQYAEAELECAEEAEGIRQAHQEYYAQLAATWGAAMMRDRQLEALSVLDTDSENVWLALSRAMGRGVAEEIESFTDLWMYYDVRSRWKEVEIAFRHACEMLEPHESVALAKLYAGRSIFFAHFSHGQEAVETAQRAFEIVQHLNARQALPMSTIAYGDALDIAGDTAKAAALYRNAIAIGEELDQPIWIAPAWFHLGHHARKKGKYDEAKANLTLCYKICAKLNNYWGMCFPLRSLGYLSLALSEFDQAREYFIKALDVARRANFQLVAQDTAFGLSAVLREMGDWQTARILAEEGFNILSHIGASDAELINSLALLAEIKIFLEELDSAKLHLTDIISILGRYQQTVNWNYWFCVTGEYFSRCLDFRRAAVLISAADRTDPEKKTFTVKELERFDDVVTRCRAALSPEEFEAAWARGQTMTNEEAIALVADGLR